jgi:tripartite-type tricarboxylate transporter receptor subunit TctC
MMLACAATALADTYPSRTIKAIIPFGAGSATDVVPRLVFEQLGSQLGQAIVVENRGGAGGTIGANAAAKSDPDGYTLLATSSAHTISPGLYGTLPYDASADFAGVGLVGSVPNVLIIAPSRGLKTIAEFVAAAKAKPNSMNFASVGIGSAVHISAERFRLSAGYEATHIPFKGGAEALTEVVAGRVDYYFCPISTALPFIRDGKVLPLVVSSPQRAASLPDVPTTLEAGFPNSDYTVWIGVFAPAKTPRPIVDKLHSEMQKALASPALQQRLVQLGVEPLPLSPTQIDERVKSEIEAFRQFAKEAGLKAN